MDTLLDFVSARGLSEVAGWLLVDASLRVTVLLAAVALVAFGLKRASATARHLIWCLGVCGALGLPLLGVLLPAWELAVLPSAEPRPVFHPTRDDAPMLLAPRPKEHHAPLRTGVLTVTRMPVGGDMRGESAVAVIVPAVGEQLVPMALHVNAAPVVPAAPVAVERPSRGAGPWAWALGAWLLGAVLVSLRLVLARVAVWHLGAQAEPVADGELLAHLQNTMRRLRVERPVRLLESDAVTLPLTWGVLHPTVLLPLDARTWTTERLDQVLLHELAHVKRLDALTQLLAQVACAFYWFHPLVWLAERRMRTLREYACDDQVLAAGTRASDYARELLEMVRTLGRGDLAHSATLAMARPSQVEDRLRAILDPARRRAALGRVRAALLGLVAFAFVVPLAALQPAQAQETPRAEQRRSRTLPRLSAEESERRQTDYRPEALEETGPKAREEEAGNEETQGGGWMADPVEEARKKAREQGVAVGTGTESGEEQGRDTGEPQERFGRGSDPEAAIALALKKARSDEELVAGLKLVLRESDLPREETRQAFLKAVERVRDPARRSGLLVQVLRECTITEDTGRTLLHVSRGVEDDGHLLKVLGMVHSIKETDVMYGPLMVDVLKTAEVLRAPPARAKALRQVLDEAPISVETGRSVLGLAAGLGDDVLARKVLTRMHEINERNLVRGPLANDYLEVTRRMGSETEKGRALAAFLEAEPHKREATLRALELAQSLGSVEARASVLNSAVSLRDGDPEVRRAVEALARSTPGGMSEVLVQADDHDHKHKHKDKDKDQHGRHWVSAQEWRSMSEEERERIRKESSEAWSSMSEEERERIREESREAARQAREAGREAARQARQEGREAAQRAREEAQRAREEAQRERERAHEEARRAREEAQRAREEAQREREEAQREAQRERVEAQREAEQEQAIAQRNSARDSQARERVEAERKRFEEAKQSLRAQAEKLRAEANKLAEQMREQVKQIRERVQRELESAEIEDIDLDDAFEYEFDVDIDVE
ncbi:MAG: hypothetical protein L0Y66_26850 [Myxococcaceae bacterium]|nr:hypothetical protein [Myxococcaceae bacterium]MCI0672445.1 hypothetical protein [Myxococcaceae bacterium]